VSLADRCVSVHPDADRTWHAARRACLDAGADLLRVDDADLLRSLADYLNNWLPAPTRWWIDGVNELWNWADGKRTHSSRTD